MNAERRANEFALLALRLAEVRDEAIRAGCVGQITFPMLRMVADAGDIGRALREYARTGPDCVRDVPSQPTMVTPADAGTENR